MNINEINILIISHNPLSSVNNNGKTLTSIFNGFPSENIYQIYLNSETPDYSGKCHYLQINEKQIIKTVLKRKNYCCKTVHSNSGKFSSAKIKRINLFNHTKRLLREVLWMIPCWKSGLHNWLKDKKFDVVFFMAGDGMFAYDIYRFVTEHSDAKKCIFFTDDYIIGKPSYSPIAVLRQTLLKRKMRETLKVTDELYVISEEMRKAYKKMFNMDGYITRNFSVEKLDSNSIQQKSNSDQMVMVYAGGLHYNRWKVIENVANALKEINNSSDNRCCLRIYSAQHISEKILERITVEGASEFLGGVSSSQISEVYAGADILLHVESFERKAIASTKYSFSTKIPEYLSADKCVMAIGPSDVASVAYLKEFASTVDDLEHLKEELHRLINDNEYRKRIVNNCEKRFESDFSPRKQIESLNHIISIS